MHGSYDRHPNGTAAAARTTAPAAGHNAKAEAAQWQTPHLPDDHHYHDHAPVPDSARDLDLVERAFCSGFSAASDPTSFLRLSGIPFEGVTDDGGRLVLIRVEHQQLTDVGSVMPHLGGDGFRYAPLPEKLASTRTDLRFAYFDGVKIQRLSFVEARALTPALDTSSGDNSA